MEPHDLAVSKLVAGREKDRAYVGVMLRHRLISPATVRERLACTKFPAGASRESMEQRLRQLEQDA